MKLNNVINEGKSLYNIDNFNLDFNYDLSCKQLNNIVYKALDKGSEYVIKSLPVPDQIKNILTDIKNSIKKDGFKKVAETAIKSSVEEGLQLIGINKSDIKDISKMQEIAEKGGLCFNLEAGIDILKNSFIKDRIPPRYTETFFESLNNYILSNDFLSNIRNKVKEYSIDVEMYLNKCSRWYKLYTNHEFDKALELSKQLQKEFNQVKNSNECISKNQIIQNVTKLSTEKQDRISDLEMKLCHNLV